MQFLLLAKDGTDAEAPARRQAARQAHLEHVAGYKAKGHMKMGAALLDEAGKMVGSVLIVDFPSREAAEAWVAADSYVTGKVWAEVTLTPCQIAPSFIA